MVHVANSSNKLNKMAVVALLFRFGPPNPFISKVNSNSFGNIFVFHFFDFDIIRLLMNDR